MPSTCWIRSLFYLQNLSPTNLLARYKSDKRTSSSPASTYRENICYLSGRCFKLMSRICFLYQQGFRDLIYERCNLQNWNECQMMARSFLRQLYRSWAINLDQTYHFHFNLFEFFFVFSSIWICLFLVLYSPPKNALEIRHYFGINHRIFCAIWNSLQNMNHWFGL